MIRTPPATTVNLKTLNFTIRPSSPLDTDRPVNSWRGAIDATHGFFDPKEL